MALGGNYATLAELKSYMGNDIGAGEDSQLNDALSSASREIERYCRRQFNDSGSVSARVYHPNGHRSVFVDDFSTTVGLVVKTDEDDDGVFENVWTATDYELSPLNGIRGGVTGWPYISIRAVALEDFPHGNVRTSVQVSAQWGWTAIPSMIHQACLELAASTYALRHARLGVAGSDQFGSVIRVSDNKMALGKLAKYRRMSVDCPCP